MICFALAFYLVLALIAAFAWFEFGRNAEEQVVDFAEDLTTMVGIVVAPIFLMGLIVVPLYRWIVRKLVGFIDHDRPQG
jgi:DMSO/TMAO reductase YedYZ heme-binding membrane subunit